MLASIADKRGDADPTHAGTAELRPQHVHTSMPTLQDLMQTNAVPPPNRWAMLVQTDSRYVRAESSRPSHPVTGRSRALREKTTLESPWVHFRTNAMPSPQHPCPPSDKTIHQSRRGHAKQWILPAPTPAGQDIAAQTQDPNGTSRSATSPSLIR